jgi:hypothetical protein
MQRSDWIALAVSVLAAVVVGAMGRRVGRRALPAMAIVAVLTGLVLVEGVWLPTYNTDTADQIASQLRKDYPDATFVFRNDAWLPLVFEMRQVIPARTDEQLERLRRQTPSDRPLVCLEQTDRHTPPLPGYAPVMTFKRSGNPLTVLIRTPSAE